MKACFAPHQFPSSNRAVAVSQSYRMQAELMLVKGEGGLWPTQLTLKADKSGG